VDFRIADLRATRLDIPLREPFTIALARLTRVTNVLFTVALEDGTAGYGEAAPWPELTGETQETVLAIGQEAVPLVVGRDASRLRPIAEALRRRFSTQVSARAGIEMAILDAFTSAIGLPLFRFLGGAQDSVETDLTIPIVPADDARRLARDVVARGISTIKTKVGTSVEEDVDRIVAIVQAAPGARLVLDANQGYTPAEALRFLDRLARVGVKPILLEQPVAARDLAGLRRVRQGTDVPVAADEAVRDSHDALAVAREGAADVVNIKLMKCGGVIEALDVAAVCRAAHIQLMIGGMIESRLAMNAAAHLAAGLGGFAYVDLDTHMLLADDPFEGGFRQDRGHLHLDHVDRGAGVRPRAVARERE
jgi:L-alanine-DL-glutamate epimerase-like enolase superfamily enzyme